MKVPEGSDFLQFVWTSEDKIEGETDSLIPALGVKASACWNEVGTVLSLLDRMASCWWGCGGGDHTIEYLCGRVASNGRAVLRLLRFGFYDEALSLCRSMGEIANLLQLFSMDGAVLRDWKNSSRRERMNRFGPARVRQLLESANTPVVIDQERYRMLSERSVHVHPSTKPQSHNFWGIPSATTHIQKAGLLVCLNELALPLSVSSAFGAILVNLDENVKTEIVNAARNLAQQIGGVTIIEIEDYYESVQEQFGDWNEVEIIMKQLQRNNPSAFVQIMQSLDI